MFSQFSIADLINISLSFITAVSASYLAYAALKHSARPNAKVFLVDPEIFYAGETVLFKFSFQNAGHWYSKPMIVNMTTYINFNNNFEPLLILHGSTQQNKNDNVKIGKGKMKYFKTQGMHLSYGEDNEEIHVMAKNPVVPGRYKIKISAFSENGLTLSKIFQIKILKPNPEKKIETANLAPTSSE